MTNEANGSEPMRVTLGEVYRAVLRVESRQKEHEINHTSERNWLVTTIIAFAGLALAVASRIVT